jgi:hypothetical protein
MGESSSDIYTVIERTGKVTVEGKSHDSPDGKKLVYAVPEKGFFIANTDGTGIFPAGDGTDAGWTDNDRLILHMGQALSVFDTVNRSLRPVGLVRSLAGTASDGEPFSIWKGYLYVGSGNNVRLLFRLPWSCNHIYAPAAGGPYLILSTQENSIFGMSGGSSLKAADTHKFINKSGASDAKKLFEANSAVAPDKDRIAFLQNENGLLQVNLVGMKEFKLQKVVVDCRFGEQTESAIKMLWLDGDRLLLHSGSQGWLLDLSKETHIYSWEEAAWGELLGLVNK